MTEGVFHFSLKAIGRSKGRSATGAIAYRAGCRITDERTGLTFDYTRKQGVAHTEIVLPEGAPAAYRDRHTLWNAVEKSETKINSTVAKEIVLALPHELTHEERVELVRQFVKELIAEIPYAADFAIHTPDLKNESEDDEGNKNHHAHVQLSTRIVTPEGFTEKYRPWDNLNTGGAITEKWRARWSELVNAAYAKAGIDTTVDHRSYKRRGIDRIPTVKEGHDAPDHIRERNNEIRAANDRLDAINREQEAIRALIEQAKQQKPKQEPVLTPSPRIALTRERAELETLRDRASTYGKAVSHFQDKSSTAASMRRELEDMKPPRFAWFHEALNTETWQRHTRYMQELERKRDTAALQAQKFKELMREYKPSADEWDKRGWSRMKEVERELARYEAAPADPPQPVSPHHSVSSKLDFPDDSLSPPT